MDGYFDARKQAIVVDEILPEGGEIVLAGRILSTGNGLLRAAHGYTSVDIQNESGYDLVLNRIDTTKKREGRITLIDTARLQKIVYAVDGDRIRETIYQGAPGTGPSGAGGVISTVTYEEIPNQPAPHGFNDTILYQPRRGLEYTWTEGHAWSYPIIRSAASTSSGLTGMAWQRTRATSGRSPASGMRHPSSSRKSLRSYRITTWTPCRQAPWWTSRPARW
ncbi:MAG: hypothetical protein JRJ83_18770 [Deltaproteobacteria bacterium]|nr:hypothetical protein [Deltaproteobacteria bacterium]